MHHFTVKMICNKYRFVLIGSFVMIIVSNKRVLQNVLAFIKSIIYKTNHFVL